MIQIAQTNIQSKIKTNGLLSDPFTLMRGVCHGYSLSILICIIAAEVLAIFINVDTRIEEVQIGEHEIIIVNFADDITFSSE